MKCNEHIGHFLQCELEAEPLFTIDTINHTPAVLVGFICPANHVRIIRKAIEE